MDITTITEFVLGLIKDYPWFGIVTSVITLASAVIALTPTPKEGSVWAKVYKVIEVVALNIGKAKDK